MDIHNLDRVNMPTEYGVQVQRLLPWDKLNAPFEGAWCVVTPGSATEPHSHHEYEMFVAVSGSSVLESDGERSPFVAGDVAYLVPGSYHQVINDSDTDFEFYSVWWDQDMSDRFRARHTAAANVEA
jgi:oxalate decarboxylase/phosphoglucose isomerase-like protein (cupin superfamily)